VSSKLHPRQWQQRKYLWIWDNFTAWDEYVFNIYGETWPSLIHFNSYLMDALGALINFLFKWKSTICSAKSSCFYRSTDFQGPVTVYLLEKCPSFPHIKIDKKKTLSSFNKLCWCFSSSIKSFLQSFPWLCVYLWKVKSIQQNRLCSKQ